MKRYRIPLSRVFPATHPKKGEHTFFREKIMASLGRHEELRQECFQEPKPNKLHTIRENVEYWKKRIDEINAGNAVLEVYEWTGKPYNSYAKTLFTFDQHSGVGYQDLLFSKSNLDFPIVFNRNDGVLALMPNNIAKNDGLSLEDFKDWFKKSNLEKPKIIIHFTDFRY